MANDFTEQIEEVFTDAKLRILCAQFLNDFRKGNLTLEETVDLIIQIRGNAQGPTQHND